MYSSCLACHHDLGRNESVEHFPVGRRLAFDAANGRFWVICPSCRRWNLSPLEERWDAIDECERLFERTRLRMSTDNIGLARIAEGTELVRVGAAMRPEMAAWRFGATLAARRRKYLYTVTGGVVITAGLFVGLKTAGGGFFAYNWAWKGVNRAYERATRLALPVPETEPRRLISSGQSALQTVRIETEHARDAHLVLGAGDESPLRLTLPTVEKKLMRYDGAALLNVVPKVLARVNRSGGKKDDERMAVDMLERVVGQGSPNLFEGVMRQYASKTAETTALGKFAGPTALALEMALNEDRERVALAGELLDLELAWREAEELARIADSLGSSSIDRALASLKTKMGM